LGGLHPSLIPAQPTPICVSEDIR